MKNAMSYYYNLNPEDIRLVNENYKFKINNEYYVLYLCNNIDNIGKIYELNQELLIKGIYNHIIIMNNNKQLITNINEKNYILFKTYDEMNKKITLEYIINFNESTSNFKTNNLNWSMLWSEKIDYFEYQVSEMGKKYPLIRESISYYIGMTETAISLLNDVQLNKFCICHRRIKKDSTTFDLYNPINFVIDTKVRDSSEYFKEVFMSKQDIIEDIKKYFSKTNLDQNELKLFFIRMLYPTFYFDTYEQIISNQIEEENIIKIINLNRKYEILLKQLYEYMKKYVALPEIEWIKKI